MIYRILIIHSYIHILNTCKFKLRNSAVWLLCNFAFNKLSKLKKHKKEQIFAKYSKCFEGLRRISDPYHIKINPDPTPVVHPPRKLPSALRDRVQNELQEMEFRGIIKKVNKPTAWVNSFVVNEKRSGKLRICIDPRDLNQALHREHYQLPHSKRLEAS